ncbi:hypothetical protein [Macellibacteroides fermentans]|uniref:hypothetical protein n=1 Tax=Macellibacteroides fermentans TaxID=879969 RepID=UPI00406CE07C
MDSSNFISQTIHFMTYSETTGFSPEKYPTYDQARKIVEERRMKCIAEGYESDLTVAAYIDPEEHRRIVGELIEDYLRSGQEIEDPMVVMFNQTKRYTLLPRSVLTQDLWLQQPYVTHGPLHNFTRKRL